MKIRAPRTGKRKREDDTNEPAQAPAGDRAGEGPHDQAACSVEPFPSATVEDLEVFLHDVRAYFEDDTPKYKRLIALLTARNNHRTLDTPGVITHIKHLFKDHRPMLERFNQVLPPENKVILPPTNLPEEYPQLVTAFLEKLKARLRGGIYYHAVLHGMFTSRSGVMLVKEDLKATDLVRLLEANGDMLEEFALVARSQPPQPLASGTRYWEAAEGPSERKEQPRNALIPAAIDLPSTLSGHRGDETDTLIPTLGLDLNLEPPEEVELGEQQPEFEGKGKVVEEYVPKCDSGSCTETKTYVRREGADTGEEMERAAQQQDVKETKAHIPREGADRGEEVEQPSLDRGHEQPTCIVLAMARRLYEYLQLLLDVYFGEDAEQKPPLVAFLSEEHMRCFREFYGDDADFVLRRLSKNPVVEFPRVLAEVKQQTRRDNNGQGVVREFIVIDE